jgi:hypothetical protein
MARNISIPEQTYPVGQISRTVDNFPPNISRIDITLTRVNWPGVPSDNVAKLTASWSDGSGIFSMLPGGTVLDKQGQPLLVQTMSIQVPHEADGSGGRRKRSVLSGTLTLDVFQPITTAITIDAV